MNLNFAVNDDWIFVRQIESFVQGDFSISNLIDPSFIFQGILGYVWGNLFGVSFTSLKILTFFCCLFFIFGIYKILKLYEISNEIIIFIILLLFFNPIIFNSTFSFMTEIYYLTFFTWSIYFLLKNKFNLGVIFSALAFLIRQYGILVSVSYLVFDFIKNKKLDYKKILSFLITFVLAGAVYIFWPRYSQDSGLNNFFTNSVFINPQLFTKNLRSLLFSLPYFIYFLLPFIFLLKIEKTKKLLIISAISLFSFYFLYKVDIFALGSVFFVEELHAKSDFRHILSISDSVVFKLLLSFTISFCFFKLLYLLSPLKFFKKDNIFLIILFCLSFFTLAIASDFYDRYLLPSFIVLVIFLVKEFKNKLNVFSPSKFNWLVLAIFCIFNLSLNLDYFISNPIKWKFAQALQQQKNLPTQVYVDDVFGKYSSAKKQNDYTGNVKLEPNVKNAVCFVQKYTLDTNNFIFKTFFGIESFAQKHIDNPRIFDSRKKEISRANNNLNKLVFNEEYASVIYNLIGRKAYVGAWCVEKN